MSVSLPNPDDECISDALRFFRARVIHVLGQTVSDPMTAWLALRVAKAWHARGDHVTIEGEDGFGEWSVLEFAKVARNLGTGS